MRLISCSLTEPQVRAGTKDVTRRLGWLNVKVGERLMFCRKIMGRKKGEPLVRIRAIEVVSVRREPLGKMLSWWSDAAQYGEDEVKREGFPEMSPLNFIEFFMKSHKGCTNKTEITRIEFKYIGPVQPAPAPKMGHHTP